MKKILTIITFSMLFCIVSIAQKIGSTLGTEFSSSSWQLSCTIGVPVINSFFIVR